MVNVRYPSRRQFLQGSGAIVLGLELGCSDTQAIPETSSLPVVKTGIQVYSILAVKIGDKVIKLPHPAAKVVGVFLLFSAAVTELVIIYIDHEQRQQELKTRLNESQQMLVEHEKAVTLVRDNEREETFPLGPNRYKDDASQ